MKKCNRKAGFTLVEMLVSLLILVLLVVGMGSGLSAATRVYRDSIFESNSAALESTLNDTLGDVLRYSEELVTVTANGHPFVNAGGQQLPTGNDAGAVNFVFSNAEYGVQQAYFYTPVQDDGTVGGPLQMKTLNSSIPVDLINKGAYPALCVGDFVITYEETEGLFQISYTIFGAADTARTRQVQCTVRMLNKPTGP